MHIGHFLYHYPQAGGTTAAVRGISRALARIGHKVTIYCCTQANWISNEDAERFSELRVVGFHQRRTHRFLAPSELRARLKRNQDGVHLLVIHGMLNPANAAVAHAARRGGIPYVVCPHGAYHPEMSGKHRLRKAIYGILYERPMLSAALAIQVLSADHIKLLADYGVRVPAFVVPNGFDPSEIPTLDLDKVTSSAGCRNEIPRFAYLGRIDKHTKGLDLLLRAISLGISQKSLSSAVRLDLVGPDWGDQANLTRLAKRLGVAEHTRFCGPVDEHGRWHTIASSDVLILPSRHDGFGLAVLEAMIAAKPVIVSEAAGISTWVRRAGCGFIVEPTSESICSGLVKALESRAQWRAMGEKGRDCAYRHLTWQKVAQQASQCYEAVLSGPRYFGSAGFAYVEDVGRAEVP